MTTNKRTKFTLQQTKHKTRLKVKPTHTTIELLHQVGIAHPTTMATNTSNPKPNQQHKTNNHLDNNIMINILGYKGQLH